MITQRIEEVWINFFNLDIEIGPITLVLLATIILVMAFIISKLIISYIATKGRGYRIINIGRLYNKYLTIIVFAVFFLLSFIVKKDNITFDDPVMLLITSVAILIFIGWTITDIRALQILAIALTGSLMGHLIASVII